MIAIEGAVFKRMSSHFILAELGDNQQKGPRDCYNPGVTPSHS